MDNDKEIEAMKPRTYQVKIIASNNWYIAVSVSEKNRNLGIRIFYILKYFCSDKKIGFLSPSMPAGEVPHRFLSSHIQTFITLSLFMLLIQFNSIYYDPKCMHNNNFHYM